MPQQKDGKKMDVLFLPSPIFMLGSLASVQPPTSHSSRFAEV